MLDEVSARTGLTFKIAAESNSFEMLRGLVIHAGMISFQISIGTLPAGNKLGVIAREIDGRDVPRANLVLGHLRGRTLPIATAVFAERLTRHLEAMRTEVPCGVRCAVTGGSKIGGGRAFTIADAGFASLAVMAIQFLRFRHQIDCHLF